MQAEAKRAFGAARRLKNGRQPLENGKGVNAFPHIMAGFRPYFGAL
jgi:hypothetical protein